MSRVMLGIVGGVMIAACARQAPKPAKAPAKHLVSCPPGAERRGAQPPKGRALWCEQAGKKHGPFSLFFWTGPIQLQGSYSHGKRVGVWTTYNRAGQRIARGRYRKGKKQGRWTYWAPEGHRTRVVSFQRGKRSSAVMYDAAGRRQEIIGFEDGKAAFAMLRGRDGRLTFHDLIHARECRRLAKTQLKRAPGKGASAELAVIILVDSTVSSHLPIVRQLLRDLSRRLRPDDLVGLFGIGRDPTIKLPFGKLGTRSLVSPLSQRADPLKHPRYCRPVREAWQRLSGAPARSRHVLLLSATSIPRAVMSLAEPIRKAGLPLSFVDSTGRSSEELKAVASAAGGSLVLARPPRIAAKVLLHGLCSESDPATCVRLGLRHLRGAGVPRDRELGLELLRLGCERKSSWGCARLGEAHLAQGESGDAALAFQSGCDQSSGYACWRLGKLHEKGRGAPRDLARARTLFQRGCLLGSSSACAAKRR